MRAADVPIACPAVSEPADAGPGGLSMVGRVDVAVGALVELSAEFEGAGAALAATYVHAALASMRFARDALRSDGASAGRSDRAPLHVVSLDGFPTAVRLVALDGGVCVRGPLEERGGEVLFRSGPGTGCEVPEFAAADLAVDALRSDRACAVADDPVAGAMMADALCGRDWLHAASGAVWSIGRSGARSVVAALRGGRAVHALQPALRGRFVDAEALACFEGLGWRMRMPTGSRPEEARRGPRAS